VARIKAYAAAGADAIYLTGLKTREELETVAAASSLPLMIGGVPKAMSDRSYLAAHNVRLALQGHKPAMLAIAAIYQAMRQLRDGTAPEDLTGLLPDETIGVLLNQPAYGDWLRRYMNVESSAES
jgi:carboxyvinyl-carboxyphosphonate phosphorylmutase